MMIIHKVDADFDFRGLNFLGGFDAECVGDSFCIWLCSNAMGRTKKIIEGVFSTLPILTSEDFNEELHKARLPEALDKNGRVDVRTLIMIVDICYKRAIESRGLRDLRDYARFVDSDLLDSKVWSIIGAMEKESK